MGEVQKEDDVQSPPPSTFPPPPRRWKRRLKLVRLGGGFHSGILLLLCVRGCGGALLDCYLVVIERHVCLWCLSPMEFFLILLRLFVATSGVQQLYKLVMKICCCG